jgi:hypothetical protein
MDGLLLCGGVGFNRSKEFFLSMHVRVSWSMTILLAERKGRPNWGTEA